MSEAESEWASMLRPNPRPSPKLADPSIYCFSVDVPTRFQDLDPLGHINNVAMAAMFEEARMRFGTSIGLRDNLEGGRILVGSLQMHYLAESFHGSPIQFHIAIGYIGTGSWRLRSVALQRDKPVVIGDASIVYTRNGSTAALPDALRALLKSKQLCLPEPA